MRWSWRWTNRGNGTQGRSMLLNMLHGRYMWFLDLPESHQREIDDGRLLPTREMNDILFHVVTTGRFFDETDPVE